MKHNRTNSGILHCLALALLLSPVALLAQQPRVPQPPAPSTHATVMTRLLADPSELSSNRLAGNLKAADNALYAVRTHSGKLRAFLATTPDAAVQAELVKYTEVASTLRETRMSLARIQGSIAACTAVCAEAEAAAISEKPVSGEHHEKMARYASEAATESGKLTAAIGSLKTQTDGLPKDPNLPTLVVALDKSAVALAETIAVCNTSLELHAKNHMVEATGTTGTAGADHGTHTPPK